MPRYVAFLRGVSPMNLSMLQLKSSLEAIGCSEVKTVLASGNAVFNSRSKSVADLERKIESALTKHAGRTFYTIIRSVVELQELIESDPYSDADVPDGAKKVVTFARKLAVPKVTLPLEKEGATIASAGPREAFSFYLPSPRGPVFMELIKSTFGSEITTRTWETVKKCAKA